MYSEVSVMDKEGIHAQLKALKASQEEIEVLIEGTGNVINVREKLNELNCNFDKLMAMCVNMGETDTMPGNTSHVVVRTQ